MPSPTLTTCARVDARVQGFFYARAGPRPIILLKEVLDYQLRHPDQHDQQSFNTILSELLVADLSVAVMHPRLFPNGFQYFNKRTPTREGGAPLVIQNNWIMGAENKRHRFREAKLWTEDASPYYRGSPDTPLRLLRFDARQPYVSGLLRETSALQAAMRVALLTGRVLLLPPTCAFTPSAGLVPPPPLVYRTPDGTLDTNVLDDDVDADWCTTEWFYDLGAMRAHLNGTYRESTFLVHPEARAAYAAGPTPPSFFIEASDTWQSVPPPDGAIVLTPARLADGASDDEIRGWLQPYADAPIIEFGDMAGRVQMPAAHGERGGGGSDDTAAELTASIERGVAYREEILRYVEQQVAAATPFECLCVPGPRGPSSEDIGRGLANLTSVVHDFAARVPRSTAVFIASYRADLDSAGLAAFRLVWDDVYALALYDWNGAGLQGRQFSSAINRLVCAQAERVHWPGPERTSGLREDQGCW